MPEPQKDNIEALNDLVDELHIIKNKIDDLTCNKRNIERKIVDIAKHEFPPCLKLNLQMLERYLDNER